MSENVMRGVTLESFEQLETGLLNWRSFIDESVYDIAGMMTLFCACLHNLQANASADEIEELCETLTPDEKDFLKRLCLAE